MYNSYIKRLSINSWDCIRKNNTRYTINIRDENPLQLVIWKIWVGVKYRINSIFELFMLDPFFVNDMTRELFEEIKDFDRLYLEERIALSRKKISLIFWEVLINDGQYYICDWVVWYYDKNWEFWETEIWIITDDVLEFNPINRYYSHDSKDFYFKNQRIWTILSPDISSFESFWESYFAKDSEYVYFRNRKIHWANPKNAKLISEPHKLLIDWNWDLYVNEKRREMSDITIQQELKHLIDDFFSDGECLYIFDRWYLLNLSKLLGFNNWSDIKNIWEGNYRIWNTEISVTMLKRILGM